MRISDWSSDVCSSDLQAVADERGVVEADRDRGVVRRGNRLGPDAANGEVIAAEIALREIDVGHRAHQFGAAFDLVVVERLGREGADRDRHVADLFLALLRRNDDFIIVLDLTAGGERGYVSLPRHHKDIAVAAITKPGAAQQRPQRRFGVGSLAVSRGALAIDDRRIDQKRYAALHAEVAQRPVERLRRYAVTCDMFARQRRVARKRQAADRRTTQQKFTQLACTNPHVPRSEEHTSELQSLMRISYAFSLLQ